MIKEEEQMKLLLQCSPLIFLLLGACGSEKGQVVKGFRYEIKEESLNLRVDFNSNTELNLETTIPVKKYGNIQLIPGIDGSGFTIGFDLNLEIIRAKEILDLRRTRNLPNGMPMTRYVKTELAKLKVKETEKYATSLYVGPDENHVYLGVALELSFLDDDFPPGLVLNQWVRDNQRRPLGVVTLYGPKVRNGKLRSPGGIFLVTNVGDLISYLREENKPSYQSLVAQNTMELGSPMEVYNSHYEKIFQNQENLKDLWDLFRYKADRYGFLD